MINTSQAPTGFLFQEQDVRDDAFDVPEDDFRVIRHAVLNLEEYREIEAASQQPTVSASLPD
jgi:hypothetical protein